MATLSRIDINGTNYDLTERYKSLRNAKMLCIGDSYSLGVVTEGGERQITGYGWVHYLADDWGVDTVHYGARGAGFLMKGVAGPETGLDFGDMITKAISEHVDDRYSFKYVVIGGGSGNDVRELVEDEFPALRVAMLAGINALRAAFPNAQIWVLPLGGTASSLSPTRARSAVAYCENAAEAGAMYSLVARSWFIGRTEYYGGDGIHLNKTGYKLEAKYMAETILGCSTFVMDGNSVVNTNVVIDSSATYFKEYRDSNVHRILGRVKLQFSENYHERATILTIPSYARKSSNQYFTGALYNITRSEMAAPIVIQIDTDGALSIWHVQQSFEAVGEHYTRGDELYLHLNLAIPIF